MPRVGVSAAAATTRLVHTTSGGARKEGIFVEPFVLHQRRQASAMDHRPVHRWARPPASFRHAGRGAQYYPSCAERVAAGRSREFAVSFSSDPDAGHRPAQRPQPAQLAERIATELGSGETTASVQSAIKIEHQPKTDTSR